MTDYDPYVADDHEEESNWVELLQELSKKHGNIPNYLYRAINERPENAASVSTMFEESCSHSKLGNGSRKPEKEEDSLASPEVHRRSPGVDSGCSVGFNDYEDEDDEYTINRGENSMKKIFKDLHDLRQTTISLTKEFINIFDVIEDIKYMNENTSSRESLSSSVSGSQEHLSQNQRQRRYHLRKLSRSVPNARGACPDVINRQHRKQSEDLRLQLFVEQTQDAGIDSNKKTASSEGKLYETVVTKSPRRASDDSAARIPKVTESLHRRSSSLSYGEKKEDQWMQNILDIDKQHRSSPSFADLLRAQTDEIGHYFQFDGPAIVSNCVNGDGSNDSVAVDVDDISMEVDKVLESQPENGIDLDAVNDKYDNLDEDIIPAENVQQHPTENHDVTTSPPYSPSLVNGDSPRRSWLHGEGRSSYHERREKTDTEENATRSRSRSLHIMEANTSDEDDQNGRHDDKSKETVPKKKTKKKLQRSPTFHSTKKYNRPTPTKKEDTSLSPLSPRYLKLLLMLEEGEATDL
ncbi:hypothetical protein BSL78_22842 [Apostichopus japonicus]|uniref:Uncharacterized protein n=1 Tax=Stichopus japonicus TaxID=307972 RepID=A0A2G8JX46_STIJA|nr:hypothetical protein BSL78_22842 [Apostichopus japonicus]